MAQTEKLFTVAGTATQNGVTKVRFANDMVSRVKILSKNGCSDINLIELPRAMTKLEALQYLVEVGYNQGPAGEAVAAKLSEKSVVARQNEVRVPATKSESKKVSVLSGVVSTSDESEQEAA
jgi:hypothetical protein